MTYLCIVHAGHVLHSFLDAFFRAYLSSARQTGGCYLHSVDRDCSFPKDGGFQVAEPDRGCAS